MKIEVCLDSNHATGGLMEQTELRKLLLQVRWQKSFHLDCGQEVEGVWHGISWINGQQEAERCV